MSALVAALPALLGQTALTAPATLQYLNLAIGVVSSGIDVYKRLDALNEDVARQVAVGRDPTPEEWDAIIARAQTAHDRLQAAAAARRPILPDESDA